MFNDDGAVSNSVISGFKIIGTVIILVDTEN